MTALEVDSIERWIWGIDHNVKLFTRDVNRRICPSGRRETRYLFAEWKSILAQSTVFETADSRPTSRSITQLSPFSVSGGRRGMLLPLGMRRCHSDPERISFLILQPLLILAMGGSDESAATGEMPQETLMGVWAKEGRRDFSRSCPPKDILYFASSFQTSVIRLSSSLTSFNSYSTSPSRYLNLPGLQHQENLSLLKST
jgi:hypothetical protein